MVGLPVLAVVARAVRVDGAWDGEAIGRILGSWRTWRVIGVTVAQAVVSAAITVAIGVPVAWVLTRYRFAGRIGAANAVRRAVRAAERRRRRRVRIAARAEWARWTPGARGSRSSPRTSASTSRSWSGCVGAAMGSLDPDLESAARVLGASVRRCGPPGRAAGDPSRRHVGRDRGLPVLPDQLRGDRGPRRRPGDDGRGRDLGAGDPAVRPVGSGRALGAPVRRGGGRAHPARPVLPRRPSRFGPAHLGRRGGHAAPPSGPPWWPAPVAVVVVSVLPLAALVERSLRLPGGHGFDHWTNLGLGHRGNRARRVATRRHRHVGGDRVRRRPWSRSSWGSRPPSAVARRPGGRADRILLLPLGVSATTIGLGLLLLAGRPPVDLRGSWWLIPLGQTLVAMPAGGRGSSAPALAAMPRVGSRGGVAARRRSRWPGGGGWSSRMTRAATRGRNGPRPRRLPGRVRRNRLPDPRPTG